MTPAEEFKEKIKAGKFLEALTLAVSEAVELKITTWISQSESAESFTEQYLSTRINIIEGEIENEITQNLLENKAYQELCKFHFEQVKQGQQIIFNNLSSLQELLTLLNQTSDWSSPELPENSPASLPFEQNSEHDSY